MTATGQRPARAARADGRSRVLAALAALSALRPLGSAAGLLAVWLVAVVGAMTVSLATLPVDLGPDYAHLDGYPLPVQALVRWDANHYLAIAQDGYTQVIQPAFYPLYPLLVHLVAATGVDVVWAGLAVSWAAALAALVFLRALARDFFATRPRADDPSGEVRARRAVLLLLVAPGAFFLACFYTEALFCALAFGAFWAARRGRWWAACLLVGLLTATRLPGLAVAGAVAVEHLAAKGVLRERSLRGLDRSTWWFLLAPAGFAAWVAWCAVALGDPLAMFHAYDDAWTYQVFDPNVVGTVWRELVRLAGFATGTGDPADPAGPAGVDWTMLFRFGIGTAAWLVCLAVTLLSARRLPASFTALSLATLLLVSLNSNLQAVNRYVLVLFPVAFALAGSRRLAAEHRFAVPVLVSTTVMVLSAVLFTHGKWVG
ncbi:mannosyltransferase family protein [Kineococcus terrestris]|uniref:mannosyltransferase family protein n=1 Tax=Kineococcus terrestris TaxID=2044856 RepID=UPI0034DABB53